MNSKAAMIATILAAAALAPAAPLRVRITGSSADAEEALWRKIELHGKRSGMEFERVREKPDYTMTVDWSRNWSSMNPPSATVSVFEGENKPLFEVSRSAPFSKTLAVNGCAKAVIERLRQLRAARQPPGPQR